MVEQANTQGAAVQLVGGTLWGAEGPADVLLEDGRIAAVGGPPDGDAADDRRDRDAAAARAGRGTLPPRQDVVRRAVGPAHGRRRARRPDRARPRSPGGARCAGRRPDRRPAGADELLRHHAGPLPHRRRPDRRAAWGRGGQRGGSPARGPGERPAGGVPTARHPDQPRHRAAPRPGPGRRGRGDRRDRPGRHGPRPGAPPRRRLRPGREARRGRRHPPARRRQPGRLGARADRGAHEDAWRSAAGSR